MSVDFMSGFLYCFWVMVVVGLVLAVSFSSDCLHKWDKWTHYTANQKLQQSRVCKKCGFIEIHNTALEDITQ